MRSLFTGCLYLSALASAISIRSENPLNEKRDALANLGVNVSSTTQWVFASSDGSVILPMKNANDIPPKSQRGNTNAQDAWRFAFSSELGRTARPALQKFLFECIFHLFDAVPATGEGVWSRYPNGRYSCANNNAPRTQLQVREVENTYRLGLKIHHLAFVLKILHDTQGVKEQAPFFDAVFDWTRDVERVEANPWEHVYNARWDDPFRAGTAEPQVL